jgi:hypothetical protein
MFSNEDCFHTPLVPHALNTYMVHVPGLPKPLPPLVLGTAGTYAAAWLKTAAWHLTQPQVAKSAMAYAMIPKVT